MTTCVAQNVRIFVESQEPHTIILQSTLQIPLASQKHGTIARDVINVDRELNPSSAKRTLTVDGDTLIACVRPCLNIYI
jgi:hypothetical protein